MQYTPRRLRLEKQKKKNIYKGYALRIFIVLLAILGMGFVLKQAHSLVIMSMTKTISVEHGILEQVIPTHAVLVRHEQVYTCPISGQLQAVAKERERVPEGALIAKVTGEGSSATTEMPIENIYARKAGIVSYQLDGLEHIITPETITKLKAESVYEQAQDAVSKVVANQQIVPSGTGIVKIVNNLKPLIMDLSLSKEAFEEKPQAGDVITFRIDAKKEIRHGMIAEIVQNSTGYRIIAEVRDWPQEFLTERLVEVEFIAESFEGIVIPETAVTEKEGVKGVYKSTSKSFSFEPIEVIGCVGESIVVSGLEAGDEILIGSALLK